LVLAGVPEAVPGGSWTVQRCQLQPRTSRSRPSARRAHLRWRAERRPASARQAAQEVGPERLGLGLTDTDRENLPADRLMDRVRDHQRLGRPRGAPSRTLSTFTGIRARRRRSHEARRAAPLRTAASDVIRCQSMSTPVGDERGKNRATPPHFLFRIYSAFRRADSHRSAHRSIGASRRFIDRAAVRSEVAGLRLRGG
jgi:hypothetical protein